MDSNIWIWVNISWIFAVCSWDNTAIQLKIRSSNTICPIEPIYNFIRDAILPNKNEQFILMIRLFFLIKKIILNELLLRV